MKRLPGARYWHFPLWYLVATLMLAAIFALHDQPDFLGPYLLLLGELLAGILVLRFNEKGKKVPHLAVVTVALCGTFVVLVSMSVCSPLW